MTEDSRCRAIYPANRGATGDPPSLIETRRYRWSSTGPDEARQARRGWPSAKLAREAPASCGGPRLGCRRSEIDPTPIAGPPVPSGTSVRDTDGSDSPSTPISVGLRHRSVPGERRLGNGSAPAGANGAAGADDRCSRRSPPEPTTGIAEPGERNRRTSERDRRDRGAVSTATTHCPRAGNVPFLARRFAYSASSVAENPGTSDLRNVTPRFDVTRIIYHIGK